MTSSSIRRLIKINGKSTESVLISSINIVALGVLYHGLGIHEWNVPNSTLISSSALQVSSPSDSYTSFFERSLIINCII